MAMVSRASPCRSLAGAVDRSRFAGTISAKMKFSMGKGLPRRRRRSASWPARVMASEEGPWSKISDWPSGKLIADLSCGCRSGGFGFGDEFLKLTLNVVAFA
jgi:hypothetical protein